MTAKTATMKRAPAKHSSPEAVTPEEQIRVPQALIGIIARPVETFRRLRESKKGYWWLVFAITVVTLAISTFAASSVRARAFAAMGANRAGPAVAGATTNQAGGFSEGETGQPVAAAAGGASAVSAVLPVAASALLALVDYGLRALVVLGMSLLLGGKATLRQAFRMSVWTTIPYALRYIVQSIAMLVAGQPSVSGLSAALTTAESQSMPILNLVLGCIDVYMLWSALLLGVGMVITAGVSKGKGLATALAYLGIALAGTLLLFAVGNALSSVLGGSLGGILGPVGGRGGGPGGGGRLRP